ncbi:MAG: lamin tail domain-containing protein [Dehalococcoidia bacterium]
MRWGWVAVGLLAIAGAVASTPVPVHADAPVLFNGDFEGGAVGWAPADGGTLTIGAGDPVNGGAAAGHVVSAGAAPVTIRTQYWLSDELTPGNEYALSLVVRIPAASMTAVTARLDLVSDVGAVLVSNGNALPGPTAGYVPLATTSVTAPPGTKYALVVITGTPTGAGARFSIDDLVLTEVIPPPPPPAPPEPVLPEDPGPAPAAATPIRISGLTPPRPTPTPESRGSTLANGQFDTGLAGWSVVQGRAWTDTWIPGQGPSLVLHTDSASVVWAEQPVNGIEAGAWYGASALLSTTGEVDVGWLRIAWYDSPDGRGRELAHDDSFAVGSAEPEVAAAPRYQVVGTHAVQAPPLAASATIRFMLRSSARAALIVDNVTFGATADPRGAARPAEPRAVPAPLETPAGASVTASPTVITGAFAGLAPTPPAPAPAPAVRATPRPTSTPRAVTAPTPRPASTPPTSEAAPLRAEDVVSPGVSDAQRALRLTQVLPDPEQPGRDNEYEWVEITNLGGGPASVEGMTLHDNSGAVTLPALVIPAGGSLVVTARLAEVAGATAFRVPTGIGNGLGNTGDRLVLVGADGRTVDAFSYGEDTAFLAGPRIPAPGTGRALLREFGPDGRFRAARVVDDPVAGRAADALAPQVAPADAPAPSEADAGGVTGAAGTWTVLLSLGAGLLGGAAMQRLGAVARRERP